MHFLNSIPRACPGQRMLAGSVLSVKKEGRGYLVRPVEGLMPLLMVNRIVLIHYLG